MSNAPCSFEMYGLGHKGSSSHFSSIFLHCFTVLLGNVVVKSSATFCCFDAIWESLWSPFSYFFPMGHGSCDMTEAHGSWAMRCRARIYLPMGHGLRKDMPIPWIMSCARICLSHGSWAAQGPISLWVMGRTTVPRSHGPWAMQ